MIYLGLLNKVRKQILFPKIKHSQENSQAPNRSIFTLTNIFIAERLEGLSSQKPPTKSHKQILSAICPLSHQLHWLGKVDPGSTAPFL